MQLVVDRENHVYTYGGKKALSITDCIRSAGLIDLQFASDYNLWLGTATHRAIELHVKGTLDWSTLAPELIPRISAWDEFVKGTGFRVIKSEHACFNPGLFFAGTLDILGVFPDEKSTEGIIEIKSGAVQRWAGVQTAAQDLLLGGETFRKRFGLSVPKSGKPKITPFTSHDDYTVFRACLTIAQWKGKN